MIKVGVSIACFNAEEHISRCLQAVFKSKGVELFVCVVDDGSTDSTPQIVSKYFPKVNLVKGRGDLWWAEATNIGIRRCLDNGCDYVIMLNPDVELLEDTICNLVEVSKQHNNAIVSPVVLDRDQKNIVMEAGHIWTKVHKYIPFLYSLRYLYKKGSKLNKIPLYPLKVVTVSGRGGLLSKKAINKLGLLDSKSFPQYGADPDYALRANNINFPMYTTKNSLVLLDVSNSGMCIQKQTKSIVDFYKYLFDIKHGDSVRVLYKLYFNNLALYKAIPAFLFALMLGIFRFWQRVLK